MAMASCARVPYICMVRADQLRKDEDEQLKEELIEVIAEIKEEVLQEDLVEEEMGDNEEDEEGVVMGLMFESAVLKAKVMELELERTYLQHKLAVANRERRNRVKRLHTRRCAYCTN